MTGSFEYTEAAICGRFQPFHRDHLAFAQRALALTEFLWIGVTRPDNDLNPCPAAPHRATALANPLSFDERALCIKIAMEDTSIPSERFRIIPFPIDEPDSLNSYLNTKVPMLTTSCDEWNAAKDDQLKKAGYQVRILYSNFSPEIRGTFIRAAIIEGRNDWAKTVTPGVAEFLSSIDIQSRLQGLSAQDK